MTPAPDPNRAVNELADTFFDGVLERDPIFATILGDDRWSDRLPDLGEEGRAADAAAFRAVLADAEAIPADALHPEQVITRDMLMLVARTHLEALEQRQYQLAVDHIFGVQAMPIQIAQFQIAEAPAAARGAAGALRRLPGGHRPAHRHPARGDRRRADRVRDPGRKEIDQIARMLALPSSDFPAVGMAHVADDAARERVRAAVEAHIYPALQALHDFLVDEYQGQARAEPGLSTTPGGVAAYELAIRQQTTIAATPDEIHTFGLTDLAGIEREMDEIAQRLGHEDRHALRQALKVDPANHTDDRAEIIRLAEDQTARAFAAAPRYFGRMPSGNCIVKEVEAYRERETPPAFYMQPSLDGSRPGQYYLNTYQPEQRALHKIAAITFHEATPGHHFQLTIEMELTGLPRFRTLGARMAGVAYSEGWGLYTERLADEMGLYLSDAERLGMLDAQAFRASRLVVDSGLHAKGWSREQAIAFMHERGTLPLVDAEIEVDRYIIWPGQALAYKVGQREIERARREVSELMGDRFDLRAFHDEVLAHGSLPLPTLRREIPGWVEAAVAAGETASASS